MESLMQLKKKMTYYRKKSKNKKKETKATEAPSQGPLKTSEEKFN